MIKPAVVVGEYSVEADEDEEDHVEAEVIEHADGWWKCIAGRWNACKSGDDGRMILTALGGRLRWSSSKDI